MKKRKELAAAYRVLRKRCRARGAEPGGAPLQEHSAMLYGALKGALPYFGRRQNEKYVRVWKLCRAFVSLGAQVNGETAAAFFETRELTLCEAEALCSLLPAAFACAAAAGGAQAYERAAHALFALREIDFEALLPRVSAGERALRRDEGYRLSDAATKAVYRRAVCRAAARAGTAEAEAISGALQKGGHIGFHLPLQKPRRGGAAFLCAWLGAAAALDAVCVVQITARTEGVWRTPAAGVCFALLLYLPVAALLRPVFDRFAALWRRPFFLPALDPEAPDLTLPKTLAAVSSLLPPAQEAAAFAKRLEALRQANLNANAAFVALVDPPNAAVPALPADAADIAALRREIDRLNAAYGGGFAMAVRERVYSQTEREYTGVERKRGAIEALVRLVTDGADAFGTLAGDPNAFKNVTYLLALDADTELPFAELQRLVCAAAHPMNRAVLNREKTAVVSGYGCFAPRLESRDAGTFFSRLFAQGGVSAYAPRVSERCMDLFGVSVFSGKGLIDAAVYRAVCVGAFPAGRVLSHDIPEGGLLRTAFVGSCAFSERFPPSPGAYYRRQHRWVRGDVQNLYLLFRPLAGPGKRRLPPLTRCLLLENAARALLPPACCLALLLSVFLPRLPGLLTFAAALLGAAAPPLFSALTVLRSEGVFGFSRVYFSACVSAGARAALRVLLCVSFLPFAAAVHTDAALRALWRLFTGRRTLQWTTASQAEAGGAALLPAAVLPFLSALLLTFGRWYHLLPAALILLLMPFAVSDGWKRAEKEPRLTGGERRLLTQYTAAMWRYFAEHAGPEDNWLPPDHVQETPVARVQHRTSPTNIGLYLCCALAAADLALLSPAELSERLLRSMKTVASLRRADGLLYNWYDTRTLEPLAPVFLSSVDCGNYLVCLTALREGLKEYLPLGYGFAALIRMLEAELANARIETLYVPRRRLFSVGRQLPEGRLSASYYDHYMSEARLTSYYAVARRKAPPSHWAALDRSFLRRGRRAAAASFSGTAFEYLMPALFLPSYENTYAREGLRGCLWAQRRRVRGTQMPCGVSESAYFAFDAELGYCYRAHGLKTLAVKRDPNSEPVFAPYVSFLALPLAPHAALKNLRRFASLGVYGPYGFYEAVDFSARARPEAYMPVRSFMAHHVGMSMLAAANALKNGLFVKRFLRDPDMAGAQALLREKIPSGAPVRRLRRLPETKTRPPRPGAAPAPETAAVYTNGEVSLLCDRGGQNRFLYGRRSMLAYSGRAAGVQAAVKTAEGLFLPVRGRAALRRACFHAQLETAAFTADTALALLPRAPALAVPLKLVNRGPAPLRAALLWYFEPLLEPLFFESGHPAFSDMRIRACYEKNLNVLLFSRVEEGRSPVWLAAGFADASPFSFCCDRERLLGFGLRRTPFDAFPETFSNTVTFTFPAAGIKTEVRLPAGGKTEKVLLLCAAGNKSAALETLSRLRGGRLPDLRRCAQSPVPAAALPYAARFLAANLFGWYDPALAQAAAGNTAPVNALWQQGISGDVPVLRVAADGLPLALVQALLGMYRALTFAGVPCDLVLLTRQAQGYADPAAEALQTLVKEAGLTLRGAAGGVYVLSEDCCSKAFLSALSACPGLAVPQGPPVLPSAPEPCVLPAAPLFGGKNGFVPQGYLIAARPPRPWSHTLANPAFGTLLTWGSLGFTWALDSRLNQLTPWQNDPCAPPDGETLLLTANGKTYHVLFGASVYFTQTGALYGAACGAASLRVTVQADAVAAKKRVRVAFTGCENAELTYRIRPLLAESEKRRVFLRGTAANGALTFCNPANAGYPGFLRLQADAPAAARLERGAGLLTVPLRGEGEVCFTLLWAAKAAALERLAALPFRPQAPVEAQAPPENALLAHTALVTRVFARTGFFQNSGAFGFRDQLQDTANLAGLFPKAARLQLLRCAAAQFPAGDVLHWFRTVPAPEPRLQGVRTRCADDALWLPWAAARYVKQTGDTAVWDVRVPFLEGAPLAPDERERHTDWPRGKRGASLYAHCAAAVKHALRFGPHGLPLFGGGDWNDSFGALGLRGPAESVWLGMFLALVCRGFGGAAAVRGDAKTAGALQQIAAELCERALAHGFNGTYFLRGFTAEGTPLGADGGPCAVDLLPQAFAAFAGIGDAAQRRSALTAAWEALWSEENKTLRLFYPPFTQDTLRAGYVNDYPPGVRENAGQYTHAAVWFYMALRREGLSALAERLLPALLPFLRYEDPALARRFLNEPYAPTADICAAPGPAGRGGWSLYTGAAGWLWRAVNGNVDF